MWICEFCEYEDIYGAPPYAMIRRYEIKDRQEREQAAERRRLLEKAKMYYLTYIYAFIVASLPTTEIDVVPRLTLATIFELLKTQVGSGVFCRQ